MAGFQLTLYGRIWVTPKGHHARIVRRLSAPFISILGVHRRQIQLVHNVAYEVSQVPFRQPLTEARRKKKILVWQICAITFGHIPLSRECTSYDALIRNSRTGT